MKKQWRGPLLEDLPIRQFVARSHDHIEMAKKHLGVEEVERFVIFKPDHECEADIGIVYWRITISPVQITRKRLRAIVGGGVSGVVRGW